MADEEQLKAGHPPAVKAGGMRIVQHKTPNPERPAKDPVEVIGLSNPPPTVQSDAVVSTKESSSAQHHHEHPAHHQKPVQNVPKPVAHQIQQPKK